MLLERSLVGWKEIEYEVMRDGADTCITICNMENFDPMGVHTGDCIVVAPSQTLSDDEYQMLRSSALRIIGALGIEGGCNVQFALDPGLAGLRRDRSQPARQPVLGPRVEGDRLPDRPDGRQDRDRAGARRADEPGHAARPRPRSSRRSTTCVVKIPRWPFDKFSRADRTIGTQMKATGEVMAIDRSFEGALAEGGSLARIRGSRSRSGKIRVGLKTAFSSW